MQSGEQQAARPAHMNALASACEWLGEVHVPIETSTVAPCDMSCLSVRGSGIHTAARVHGGWPAAAVGRA